jgi:hypothetical protein
MEQLCNTNQHITNICKNKFYNNGNFWKDKMIKDNLPTDAHMIFNMSTYINLYRMKQEAKTLVAKSNNNYIIFYFNEENLLNILPPELLQVLYKLAPFSYGQEVIIKLTNVITITYKLYINNDTYTETIKVSKNDIINIITKIFYYYPTVTYF